MEAVLAGDQQAERELWIDSPEVASLALVRFDLIDTPESVEITWQLPDDQSQRHHVPIIVSGRAGRERLSYGPTTGATPLWRLGVCTTTLGERSGLIALGAADDGHWAGRALTAWGKIADRAAAAVHGRTGADLVRVWLQLPATPDQLSALGAAPADDAAAGAWVVGDGPVHVLLDPVRVGALTDDEALALLTHEIVHVVTDAPRTDLPLWVEEGYAEAVTWADDEAAGWRQAAALLEQVRAEGVDMLSIPTDDDFTGSFAEPYARAWTLCRWLQEDSGADDQWQWLRNWYGSVTSLTDHQVEGWRGWLVDRAERS